MGFFSYAYVIEGTADDDSITLAVSAYSAHDATLFSWRPGERAPGLQPLGGGTLFCANRLDPLPGYPRLDHRKDVDGVEIGVFEVEENFFAPSREEPVLFHIALPPGFVFRPKAAPFVLPADGHLAQSGDRLIFTWPTVGGGDLRFYVARLRADESLSDYDLGRILLPPVGLRRKWGFELNFGIVKFKTESA
jgi:hypothetical protein